MSAMVRTQIPGKHIFLNVRNSQLIECYADDPLAAFDSII